MQKYLLVSLCVLATFILIDAKPWYGNEGMDSGGSYVAYNERYGYHSQNGFEARGGSYPGGGNGDSGQYGKGGGGQYGYGGVGQYGYGGSGQYGNGGGGQYGNGGSGQYGNGGSGQYGYGGQPYNYGFVPEHCPNCDIKSYGSGRGQTNTFNLARNRR